MSRHEIAGREHGTRVVVGWDHPLETYFVHVFHVSSRREGPSVWLGGSWQELYRLEDLQGAIRPYVDLPVELLVTLGCDRDGGR